MTKAIRYFWIGFKNAFSDDVDNIKREYPIKELWEISIDLDRKFQKINEKTSQKIKKHLKYTATN